MGTESLLWGTSQTPGERTVSMEHTAGPYKPGTGTSGIIQTALAEHLLCARHSSDRFVCKTHLFTDRHVIEEVCSPFFS